MPQLKMELLQNGEVTIPQELYTSMGWQIGERLIVRVENGEMKIVSQAQAIVQTQEWVASFIPMGRSLSDELIAERRLEQIGE